MMMLRTLTATLLTALMLGTACAAPVLRADVAVTGSVVTIGDMFDDVGPLAEEGLFRAPLPGTSGLVSLADIKSAADRVGLGAFNANGIASVRVTRNASRVDETVLVGLIATDLTQRGILTAGTGLQTRFAHPFAPINAEAVAEPARLVSLNYAEQSGLFVAQFAIAGQQDPLTVDGAIELTVEAPFLIGARPAGTVLTPDDIVMRPIAKRSAMASGYATLDELVGKQLRRATNADVLVATADVSQIQLIGRNDMVTIYFRQGPMTLTVKGQALGAAPQGGAVQVLNLMSKRVISAKAIAAGAVEVSNDPLTLAGL